MVGLGCWGFGVERALLHRFQHPCAGRRQHACLPMWIYGVGGNLSPSLFLNPNTLMKAHASAR